jgi:hypothetical protein
MLGLSLDFGIWIRDAGRSRLGGTHRITIEFTLSLSKGLDSEFVCGERFVELNPNPNGISRRECSQNQMGFVTCCFYKR